MTTAVKTLPAANSAVQKRVAKDGKARKLPKRKSEAELIYEQANRFHHDALGFLENYTMDVEDWLEVSGRNNGDAKAHLMEALNLVADGFAKLARKLDGHCPEREANVT